MPPIFAQSDADAAVDDCDDDDDKTLVAARERLVRLHRCKASCLRVRVWVRSGSLNMRDYRFCTKPRLVPETSWRFDPPNLNE